MKYAFIQSQSGTFAVTRLCAIFDVCRSAYYAWRTRLPSRHEKEDKKLAKKIKISHKKSRDLYGARRIQDDLKDEGIRISKARVRRLMKQEGLQSKRRNNFKITTNSNHQLAISPDLLQREFVVEQPNQAYVSDITYIWTSEGWLYLAITIDLFSRLVVGWSLSSRMFATLVTDALNMAIATRNPQPGPATEAHSTLQMRFEIY